MTEGYDEKEYCQLAFEEAFNLCSNPEDAFRQVAMFMGFAVYDEENVFPIEDHYLEILENELSDAICADLQSTRAWVLSRAWQIHKEEDEEVIRSIHRAWEEFNERCIG